MLDKLKEIVTRRGYNVYDAVYSDFSGERSEIFHPGNRINNCYSVSKSVTATALIMLDEQGKLSLDDTLLKYYGKMLTHGYDRRLENVTLEHLVTHTMGYDRGFMFEEDCYEHGSDDWQRFILAQPLSHQPGTHFAYSNTGCYLLSCIAEKVTGMPLDDFVRKALFNPLGIRQNAWWRCPNGHTAGATGLFLTTEDMAKFGKLWLGRGKLEGTRYFSEKWAERAVQRKVMLDDGKAYAYGFWYCDDSENYYCSGKYGQIILIMPKRGAVLAMHSYDDFSDSELIKELLEGEN